MATAEVLLPETVASSLDQGGSFTSTVTINTAEVIASPTSTTPAQIKKDYFVLNTQSFIDLQIYVKAALRLPDSATRFESTYPQKMFKQYMDKDTKPPALYDVMSTTLVGINNHCFDFSANTMGPMISLAGYIANFADTAASQTQELNKNLTIIYTSGSNIADPRIKEAVETAQLICVDLGDEAKSNREKCKGYVTALSTFKATTVQDKNYLDEVNRRSDLVLPTTAELNADLRKQMEIASSTLKSLVKQENNARDKAKANSGVRWYYFIPWIGWGLALADTLDKSDAERAIHKASEAYAQVASQAEADLATVISFRSICSNLVHAIDTIHEAIQKAEEALTNMMGAFSNLETGLDDVANKLDAVKGYVEKGSDVRLKAAFKRLEGASATWAKVVDLAKQFQANGLLMEANMHPTEATAEPPPSLDILSANYGGVDYTDYAKILFNSGENLRIRSVEPGFPEAWEKQTKSISVLHAYGTEKRIFVCAEYTGTHTLLAGPMADSRDGSSVLNDVRPFPKPSDAQAEILSIVYGKDEVVDRAVYDYCYQQLRSSQPIRWSNETMGGDKWVGQAKSGTVFFSTDGGKKVMQCTGREGSETRMDV